MSTEVFDIHDYRLVAGGEFEDTFDLAPAGVIKCGGKSGRVTIVAVRQGDEIPANTVSDGPAGVIFIPEVQFPWYLDLLRNESRVSCSLDLSSPKFHRLGTEQEPVGESEAPPAPPSMPDLREWLLDRPHIADALIWDGHRYADWDGATADKLADYFEAAWEREPFGGISEPPANVAVDNPFADEFRQVLDSAVAKRLYLGYAAHSLALEIAHRLPWSISGFTPSRLRLLLDSRKMFRWALDGFEVDGFANGDATPCSVGFAWRFLRENNLLDNTPLKTVARVLEWCRDNMSHFRGETSAENYEDHWGYRGFPPVSRIIEGTTGPGGFSHWTAGCHGTSGFLRIVLRAANIPVGIAHKPDGAAGQHALPTFPSIGRAMTHGDDPYNQNVNSGVPMPPGEELLISMARFDQLFGPQVSEATQARNVGRRPGELALQYLPVVLLERYCEDLDAGTDHESGEVFQWLSSLGQSVEQLEEARLWERMDAKLEALGGCGNLPV